MAIEAVNERRSGRKLRLGMVGGGQGAFIGAVHRMAARLDDRWEVVAGAFSSDPDNTRATAAELGLAPERAYATWDAMAEGESRRDDRIDAVAIVTPNHLHFGPAKAFLEAGIHVICDKPMTFDLAEAVELVRVARKANLVFVLTQNNTGYPLVRQARAMVREGLLGALRVISVSYVQDWLAAPIEADGHKQAGWRTDPARSGMGGAIADIGVHAFNLATFVSGLAVESVCADLRGTVGNRALDDNANVLLRFVGGATGTLWASQVAPGNFNRLSLGVYGEKAGLNWLNEDNDNLTYAPFGEPVRIITRSGPGAHAVAARASRLPPRHGEGFIESFANLYSDAAELISARLQGRAPDPGATDLPTVEDGARGLAFIEACVASSRAGAVWTAVRSEF